MHMKGRMIRMSIECKWCGMELTDKEIGEHKEICDNCTEAEIRCDFAMSEEEAENEMSYMQTRYGL